MLRLENARIDNGGFFLDADLTVEPGQRVAVIGPSGAGKSTLLGAIAGFYPLTRGRILWGDSDITYAAPGKRPVAMLFQDGNLFPHLTVAQNAGLGIRSDLRLDAKQKARVDEALARVGLHDLGDRKPAELSGGQQSRAALARVLLQDRPLLLLDEPFAALGPALKAEMLDLVATLATETGAALLMVSHDPTDARRIARQVILVTDGHAAPPAETKALFANPPKALREYLG
ncbi:MAG: ATP-binding cassette domain-containing protein [Pseudooceanicola sp.]|nr:ATP-binding cassette domain-containing protein [Pseudooceanicola sp.]